MKKAKISVGELLSISTHTRFMLNGGDEHRTKTALTSKSKKYNELLNEEVFCFASYIVEDDFFYDDKYNGLSIITKKGHKDILKNKL